MADSYLRETAEILAAVDRDAVRAVVDVLEEAWKSGRTVYTFGNGGSASTGAAPGRGPVQVHPGAGKAAAARTLLNDNLPLLSALTNDDGWEEIYVEQLRTWWSRGDVAFGLSVHGGAGSDRAGPWSQNVVVALRWARDHGGAALGLAGFDGGPMAELATPVSSCPRSRRRTSRAFTSSYTT